MQSTCRTEEVAGSGGSVRGTWYDPGGGSASDFAGSEAGEVRLLKIPIDCSSLGVIPSVMPQI